MVWKVNWLPVVHQIASRRRDWKKTSKSTKKNSFLSWGGSEDPGQWGLVQSCSSAGLLHKTSILSPKATLSPIRIFPSNMKTPPEQPLSSDPFSTDCLPLLPSLL